MADVLGTRLSLAATPLEGLLGAFAAVVWWFLIYALFTPSPPPDSGPGSLTSTGPGSSGWRRPQSLSTVTSTLAAGEALEALWDAFEQVKTVIDPTNKKRSAETLVDLMVAEPASRRAVANELDRAHLSASSTPFSSMALSRGLPRTSWNDRHAVISGHFLVRGVDVGLVAVCLLRRREVVGDDDPRQAAHCLESVHLGGEPRGRAFCEATASAYR